MAQVFYRAGFIEAWGRGYEKIMNSFDKANLRRPEFTVEQGGVTAVIYREIFMSIRGDQQPTQTEIKSNQNRTKTDIEPIQNDTEPIQNRTKSEERTIILGAIKNNPFITMDTLSDLLKITKSSVQRRLDALVKEGRLRHIGPTKGGSWEVLE